MNRRDFIVGAICGATATAITTSALPAHAKPRPTGAPGVTAEDLTDKMLAAVNASAWTATNAITWKFGRLTHTWDRARNFDRIEWGNKTILIDIASRRGIALKRGERIGARRERKLVEKAWARWANDSFWLNPVVKARDAGTSRSVVELEDGAQGLLVSYSSGGVTPGDAYLWILDPVTYRPVMWKMWVSVVPIGGVQYTWEGWEELETGAWISTHHDGAFDVTISNVRGAPSLTELDDSHARVDPFAELLAFLEQSE